MANFKTVNPEDNPQPGDANYAGPYPRRNDKGEDVMPGSPGYDDLEMSEHEKQVIAAHAGGPGPRYGLPGVDKPHGGGSLGSEQAAADRRRPDPSRMPGGNPNNPNDRNNPDSTDARADRAAASQQRGASGVDMAKQDALELREKQHKEALASYGMEGTGTGESNAKDGRPAGDASAPQSGVYDPKSRDETPSLANEQRDKDQHGDQDRNDPSRKDRDKSRE